MTHEKLLIKDALNEGRTKGERDRLLSSISELTRSLNRILNTGRIDGKIDSERVERAKIILSDNAKINENQIPKHQ